jgi:hypothetical protein
LDIGVPKKTKGAMTLIKLSKRTRLSKDRGVRRGDVVRPTTLPIYIGHAGRSYHTEAVY